MYPIVTLKPGKEATVQFRHPWIFSGALGDKKEAVHGGLVQVATANGMILGVGTYNSHSTIAVRMVAYDDDVEITQAWFVQQFRTADAVRAILGYGPGTQTTGYRVVFGETDGLPGLVVDRYEDVLVLQISTAGMDALRSMIVAALEEVFQPASIIENSDIAVRREEGLEPVVAVQHGPAIEEVEFREHGRRCIAQTMHGQKTGFFLDQKDLREEIKKLASGHEVLNLFSYSGVAGVAAMQGGAKSVHHIDSSDEVLALCLRHAQLNDLAANSFTTENADAFGWLGVQREPSYDMVIMDPPALIKTQKDVEEGKKAYHFLNRAALRLVRDGGIFVTSSCSHFMPEEDMAFMLRRASVQNGVELRVLGIVRQSADHPPSVYFPGSSYLKSFVCMVRRH